MKTVETGCGCEGSNPAAGDPTDWYHWMTVDEPREQTWIDKHGELRSYRWDRRPRTFCPGGTCITRWIYARSQYLSGGDN